MFTERASSRGFAFGISLAIGLLALRGGLAHADPSQTSQRARAGDVAGVWKTQVARPFDPDFIVLFVFHRDGVFQYSSGSDVSGLPCDGGFDSRLNGHGSWKVVSRSPDEIVVEALSEEVLTRGGAGAGTFLIKSTFSFQGDEMAFTSRLEVQQFTPGGVEPCFAGAALGTGRRLDVEGDFLSEP